MQAAGLRIAVLAAPECRQVSQASRKRQRPPVTLTPVVVVVLLCAMSVVFSERPQGLLRDEVKPRNLAAFLPAGLWVGNSHLCVRIEVVIVAIARRLRLARPHDF